MQYLTVPSHSYTLSLFIDVPPPATHRTRSPPPLTGLTSGGGEEATKHPGIPVSSSPTSPRTHDHVVCLLTMYMCIIPYSTTFLWVFDVANFVDFQSFAKLFLQTFLTHKVQSLRSDCKTIDGQHPKEMLRNSHCFANSRKLEHGLHRGFTELFFKENAFCENFDPRKFSTMRYTYMYTPYSTLCI